MVIVFEFGYQRSEVGITRTVVRDAKRVTSVHGFCERATKPSVDADRCHQYNSHCINRSIVYYEAGTPTIELA